MATYTLTTLPQGIRSLKFIVTPDNQQIEIGDTINIKATVVFQAAEKSGDFYQIIPGIRVDGYKDTIYARSQPIEYPRYYFSVLGQTSVYILRDRSYSETINSTITVTERILAGLKENTGSIFVGFSLGGAYSGVGRVLGVGATTGLTVSSTGYTMPSLNDSTYSDEGNNDPLTTVGYFVQNNSSPILNIAQSDISIDSRFGSVANGKLTVKNQDNTVLYNNTFSFSSTGANVHIGSAPKSGIVTWELWMENQYGIGGIATGSYTVLPYSNPQLSFAVARYSEVLDEQGHTTYEESDDGEDVWVNAQVDVSSLNNSNAWTLELSYAPNDNGGILPMTLVTESDGGSFSYPSDPDEPGDRSLINLRFSATKDYTFTATLTDQFNNAEITTYIYKAGGYFNVEKFGVRVGGRTTGTGQNPKFESDYTAYMYAGIAGVNNYPTVASGTLASAEELTGGHWVDGKPLYRRIYHITSVNSSNAADVDISDLDYDFIKWEGYFNITYNTDTTEQWLDTYNWGGNNDRARVYIYGTTLRLRLGGYLHLSSKGAWIILEYTKNTTT